MATDLSRGHFDTLLLEPERFDQMVLRAIYGLGPPWRGIAAEIPIIIDDEPDLETMLALRGAIESPGFNEHHFVPRRLVKGALPAWHAVALTTDTRVILWPAGHEVAGLFHGYPRGTLTWRTVLNEIRIFRGACQRMSATPAALERQIRNVIEHELGHYLGLTEPEIAAAHHRP